MSAWSDRLRRILAAAVGPAPAPATACRVCGKQLTSRSSIERGMGACCARKVGQVDDKTLDLFESGTPGSELQ